MSEPMPDTIAERMMIVNYEYTSKRELRRIARGALNELYVHRELVRRAEQAKND